MPASTARAMGADIVIAVDISQQPKDQPFPQDIIDILKQSLRIMRQSVLAYQIESAQIVIRPGLGKTPVINADGKLRLIKDGEDAAIAMLPQIRGLIKK